MGEAWQDRGQEGYDRPNQEWSCGRSSDCRACPLGPSKWGACRATGECIPRRQGLRWVCSRPAAQGGKCSAGPLPDGTCARETPRCKPIRSIGAKKASLSLLVFATTATGLAWMSTQPAAQRFVSPGELTKAHSSLKHDCNACHAEQSVELPQLIRSATHGFDQSARCLDCHELGPHARQPHSVDPAQLASLTSQVRPLERHHTLLQSLVRAVASPLPATTACSTCHREHAGGAHDLTRISSQRCQTCHVQSFASFADGHPEFVDYPYQRRTRIRFDHQTHYRTHFVDSARIVPGAVPPAACSSCHTTDMAGNMILLRGYETSCASCHDAQVRDDSLASAWGRAAPGWAFFQLPPLDPQLLQTSGAAVGEWPHLRARPDYTLPAFMQLLLLPDHRFQAAAARLRSGRHPAGPEYAQVVETYVWTIKELIEDLCRGGSDSLRRRLEQTAATTDTNTAASLTDALVASSFPALLRLAQQVWLPNLSSEVAAYRQGSRAASILGRPPALPPVVRTQQQQSGWTRYQADLSLGYQPVQHADLLIRRWVEHTISLSDSQLAVSFDQTTDPTAPGRCIKCHTIDRQAAGRSEVNWFALSGNVHSQQRSDFDHKPHLLLLGEDRCWDCHQLGGDLEFIRREFLDVDGQAELEYDFVQTSGFVPISKQRCSQCHTAQRAPQSCLTCHRYHRPDGRLLP